MAKIFSQQARFDQLMDEMQELLKTQTAEAMVVCIRRTNQNFGSKKSQFESSFIAVAPPEVVEAFGALVGEAITSKGDISTNIRKGMIRAFKAFKSGDKNMGFSKRKDIEHTERRLSFDDLEMAEEKLTAEAKNRVIH